MDDVASFMKFKRRKRENLKAIIERLHQNAKSTQIFYPISKEKFKESQASTGVKVTCKVNLTSSKL